MITLEGLRPASNLMFPFPFHIIPVMVRPIPNNQTRDLVHRALLRVLLHGTAVVAGEPRVAEGASGAVSSASGAPV